MKGSEEIRKIVELVKSKKISKEDGYKIIDKIKSLKESEKTSERTETKKVKRLVLDSPLSIQDIKIVDGEINNPVENEVQILVKAFALNFSDLLSVKGMYPNMPSYPFTPGLEVSGIILQTGTKATKFKVGDEVIAILDQDMGGNATIVNTKEEMVCRKPSNLSFEEGCSIPIAFLTAYHTIEKADINNGDRVLIHTATSGVGLITIQLAKEKNALIFTTVGSDEKLHYLKSLGIQHVINYLKDSFDQKILEKTNHQGVNVVINTLPSEYIQKGLNVLAPFGRYIEIAMLSIKKAEQISFKDLNNNQSIYSVDLMRFLKEKPDKLVEYLKTMERYLANGIVKPTISKVYDLVDLSKAYEHISNRKNIGKVVISVNTDYNDELYRVIERSSFDQGFKYTLPHQNDTAYDVTVDEVVAHNSHSKDEKIKHEMSEILNTDIAIIGVSGRFPEAENVHQFWRNLKEGKSGITEVPKSRWDIDAYYSEEETDKNKTYCKYGGFLSDIEFFDAKFFNMSAKEAQVTDPQQRIFLEEAWNSIEDAGYSIKELEGKRCGVYVGVGHTDYLTNSVDSEATNEPQALWGNESSILPARVSYFLNLKGGSIAINTACSSSLVAIHQACKSIIFGEHSMAIAGGAFISTSPAFYISTSKASMLAKDGKCKAFDDSANGFIPGECVAAIVLKSLKDAIRDGDHIYGVIKGSEMNQDGKTNGITAPSSISQTEVQHLVYQNSGINPETISYIEAHGTGTKLGDPIEIDALTNSFSEFSDKKQFCRIGSVKTNIGHTSASAGIAGVIKILLSIKHGQLPKSLNFTVPNRHINFEDTPFIVNDELTEWRKENNYPRRAAINSFGFSGTNVHMVIEEPPFINSIKKKSENYYLVPLSARSKPSLIQNIEKLMVWLKSSQNSIEDICYTLGRGRSHFHYRICIVVKSLEELRHNLINLLDRIKVGQYEVMNIMQKGIEPEEIELKFNNSCKEFNKNLSLDEKKQILAYIGELYLQGLEIPWKKLYQLYDGEFRRVSLPTYSFQRERFWIPASKKVESKKISPTMNKVIDHRFFIDDHLVKGEKVVPGMGQVQYVMDAFHKKYNRSIIEIKNVVWSKIITEVDLKNLEVTFIQKDDNQYAYHITNTSQISFGEGTIIINEGRGSTSKHIDTDFTKYKKLYDVSKLYSDLKNYGLEYGQNLKSITRVASKEKEILSLLQVNQDNTGISDISIVILDGALQTLMALNRDKNIDSILLPFIMGEIHFHKPLEKTCYVYAKEIAASTFDIMISNVDGEVLVEIKKIIVSKLKDRGIEKKDTEQEHKEEKKKKEAYRELKLYRKVWREKAIVSDNAISRKDTYLIFDNDAILFNSYKTKNETIQIKSGSRYKKVAKGVFEINPSNPLDYTHLMGEIHSSDVITIIYNWKDNVELDTEDKEFDIVFCITQALLKHTTLREVKWINLYYDESPKITALAAYFKTLWQEHPSFKSKLIHLYHGIDVEKVINDELQNMARYEVEVSYFQKSRHVKEAELIKIPKEHHQSFQIDKEGIYIITGGIGKISLIMAKYLIDKGANHILLLGRREIDLTENEEIAKLFDNHSNIQYYRCDVSDEEKLKEVLEKVREQRQVIKGVFHCAGTTMDKVISGKNLPEAKAVLAAKIQGTVLLDRLTAKDELDFFICFSSLAAYYGNIGQCDYAYGNSFMDQFMTQRNLLKEQAKRSGHSVAINWPLWANGGMLLNDTIMKTMKDEYGVVALDNRSALLALEKILNLEETEVMVTLVEGDDGMILNNKNKRDLNNKRNESELKEYIKSVIATETGFSKESLEDYEVLDNYGVDSAINLAIIRGFEKRFGDLPKTLLFEYKTINQLTSFFIENYPMPIEEENIMKGELQVKEREMVIENKKYNNNSDVNLNSDIAIIGVSGIYPGAKNIEELWEVLINGKDCITTVPKDRWNHEEFMDKDSDKLGVIYTDWGGFIDNIDKFDPLFFNTSPLEAELMDPQERLFLKTAWHTIEDAAYTPEALSKEEVGVYVGVMYSHYQLNGLDHFINDHDIPAVTSSYASIANRVSYCLNLNGPSVAIDTMCSSSLTAIHLACESIRKGESTMAIAGGVNLTTHPYKYKMLCQAKFLSEDGRCRSFGDGGTGYVPSEGVGAVLLKPLEKAIEDNDNIYATIKGSAINHGGLSNGYTVPDPNAQYRVVSKALEASNVKPEEISYIEAHGTGTMLGDPIEIRGLQKVFGTNNKKCPIGSIKSNIGHAEAAAGIAAVTKVLLQMKHQKLVPTIHSQNTNKEIDFDNSSFYLQHKVSNWEISHPESSNSLRKAAVSSFGAGGANAHIILEEWRDNKLYYSQEENEMVPVILSAKSELALKQKVTDLLVYLKMREANVIGEQVDEEVVKLLAQVINVDRKDINLDDDLSDYGIDYLRSSEILTQMIRRFSIQLTTEDIINCKRVLDVINIVKSHIPTTSLIVNQINLMDIAYTLNTGRVRMKYKCIFEAKNVSELIDKLENYENNNTKVIEGSDLNINFAYKKAKKISLPVYPFEEKRYWIGNSDDKVNDDIIIKEEISSETIKHDGVFLENERLVNDDLGSIEVNNKDVLEKDVLDKINEELVLIIQKLLKIDRARIDIDDNVGEYGFNSITFKEFADQISGQFSVEVAPTVFFSENTIRNISKYLIRNFNSEIVKKFMPDALMAQSKHQDKPKNVNTNTRSIIENSAGHNEHGSKDIAIIGVSGAFPNAKSIDEYWDNMLEGRNCISEIPQSRWDWKEYYEYAQQKGDKINARWGGFVDNIQGFDEKFFNISPLEAEMMDPQQRLFLQHTWHAIEDAGFKKSDLSGSKVGVFVGAQFQDYQQVLAENGIINAQMGIGNELSIIANRVSYFFNFNGPSEVVNTACSSSLVAVNRAIQSIANNESEIALAGGVSLIISPNGMISADKMGILSKTGSCKTLDQNADGYVKGEGIGIVVLKPLSKAIEDKDHIYAVIKASSVNHGGKATSLTAPNSKLQSKLLVDAYTKANVSPDTISYIELHGTGTQLGDPIEIEGLKTAFNELNKRFNISNPEENYCGIGSVKTNIGHLEPAAGIAGLIKLALCMKNKKIPKIINFKEQNRYINLERSPFYIVQETRDWKNKQINGKIIPNRAGVSSFGFGGVNAHVVLEEYIEKEEIIQVENKSQFLITLSATNEVSLQKYVDELLVYLDSKNINTNQEEEFLGSMEYTLMMAREEMQHRIAFICSTIKDLREKLLVIKSHKNRSDIYVNAIDKEKGKYDFILEEFGDELITKLLRDKKYHKILKYWVMGGKVNWSMLWSTKLKKLSLPKYPFLETKHWFTVEPKPVTPKTSPMKQEERENKNAWPKEIVALNTRGSKLPSFWVHGAPGFGSLFNNLSKVLGKDYPMYAFQAKGISGKEIPRRLDEMVEEYIRCIKLIQPNGPYIIGGYSFGGLVAFQIAKVLSETGDKVCKLIMLDTFPSTQEVINRFYSDYDSNYFVLTMGNELCRASGSDAFITYEDIEGISERFLAEHVVRLVKERTKNPMSPDDIYNYIMGAKRVSDYAEEAYKEYEPKEYKGSDVLYFRATKGYIANDNHQKSKGLDLLDGYDYLSPWRELINNTMEVVDVPSDHFNILEKESLEIVCKKLKKEFDQLSVLNMKAEVEQAITIEEVAASKEEKIFSDIIHGRGTSSNQYNEDIVEEVSLLTSHKLKIPIENLDTSTNLSEYGVDSMLVSSLLEEINSQFGVSLAMNDVYEDFTIYGIGRLLMNER
ncbi:SDR family NAD(P)-dependent oxidoreductase [Halalkalibacter sp. APA_J-10(15)]|uniref:SDR family NAD(P)-dependent oxidoreductase n=1 Tax=Halalkalibacter sp. APA_J-10(15) TaxID=2933805 RepID=UPI001FF3BAEE|nr:SDR family NAD(P)-dependent oxidoreductase [Halalkalibacter sp. APA_J-10(15)]MCK0471885.1 SDR family NAD(P)-dependent oxidoreductase [Halalkalibacter sp. APA_J-10(15)]